MLGSIFEDEISNPTPTASHRTRLLGPPIRPRNPRDRTIAVVGACGNNPHAFINRQNAEKYAATTGEPIIDVAVGFEITR